MKAVDLLDTFSDNAADAWALARGGDRHTDHRLHLYVWGLRRSGNHAIMNWIEGMAPDPDHLLNFNDLSCFQNPWRQAWRYWRRKPDHRRLAQLRRYPLYRDADADTVRREARGRHREQDLVLFSFEDYAPGLAFGRYFRSLRQVRYGAAAARRVVMVLRDPFNLLASRTAHHRIGAGLRRSGASWIQCWQDYARYAIAPPTDTVVVNFDRWLIDRDYRRALAESLGLPYGERDLDRVGDIGGGSSFEGTRGNADPQRLLGRWRECTDTDTLDRLRADPGIRRHVDALFADIPGLPDAR